MNKAAEAVVGGWTVSPDRHHSHRVPLGTLHGASDPRARVPADCVPIATEPIRLLGRSQAPAGAGGGLSLWFAPATIPPYAHFGTCARNLVACAVAQDTTLGI